MKNPTIFIIGGKVRAAKYIMRSVTLGALAHIILLTICGASQAQVVFIDTPGQQLSSERLVQDACLFYGLDIVRINQLRSQNGISISKAITDKNTRAIIITARALESIDVNDIQDILKEDNGYSASVLITEITEETDPRILKEWSFNSFADCASMTPDPPVRLYSVSSNKEITRQLSGIDYDVPCEKIDYLIPNHRQSTQVLIELRNRGDKTGLPIFAKTADEDQNVFLLTRFKLLKSSIKPIGHLDFGLFLEIAPLMMFLRHSCGELCWHSPGYYANLTIDDPWLVEPYGFLSYKGLQQQMDNVGFHLTIAFVPWNYDRSKEDVVFLLKNRPDRFSICFHGNDHDHYEFYKYKIEADDTGQAVSLDTQEKKIRQAIARMEEFRNLTGISCDRVMVFPQGIAPADTLGQLKSYNFLFTANGYHVPLGSKKPDDPFFSLRQVTLSFGNFASLDRDLVKNRNKTDIAADLFLGNPLLFYDHQDLFRHGIDSFNKTAETVNHIEPKTRWSSLDYIARRLYLERVLADGIHEINTFCRSIVVENTNQQEVTYLIRKRESFNPSISKVLVDGKPHLYHKSDGYISLDVTAAAGQTRSIEIEYENDLDLTTIDISKTDPRVRRLRKLSDFRDITLSKSLLGRAVISVYYSPLVRELGVKYTLVICCVLAVLFVLAVRRILRGRGRQRFNNLQTDSKSHK